MFSTSTDIICAAGGAGYGSEGGGGAGDGTGGGSKGGGGAGDGYSGAAAANDQRRCEDLAISGIANIIGGSDTSNAIGRDGMPRLDSTPTIVPMHAKYIDWPRTVQVVQNIF